MPSGEVRVLTQHDTAEALKLLQAHPVDNIVVLSKVLQHGVERPGLGNDLLGYWENGLLVSLLSDGYSLQPVSATPAALDAFADRLDHRRCGSILGVHDQAMGLWQRLCERSFTQWASPREVRDHQLVMTISGPPKVAPAPVQALGTRNLDSYHAASVAMYTEEVGVAPMDPQGSYRDHVASLMMKGSAFGMLQSERVVFKADLVADAGSVCQVGGVWLAPQFRGQGASKPLMAGVVERCQERCPAVSLYVNSFNLPAIRCYEAVGFTQVGQCATILY
ncbi:MAG: GNAT family N-acetyltransferase [Propionibacteriaceae bacterium]|nr:GNAT family N-acetyltransferase [Propionibacteriaceae bacterium]